MSKKTPPPPAARLGDPVAHSQALGGFLAGALVGLAAAAGVAIVAGMAATAIAAEVATAGLATPLVAGVAVTVGEFAVNAAVGGALTGMAERAGEALGSKSMGPASGAVSQGSANVLVNGLPAARVGDAESCHGGQVAQGSTGVFINGRPAARKGDKTTCGAVIVGGSGNVFIGGGVTTRLPIQSEVPQWVRWAAVVVGLLPALGGAARAVGSAIAEVAETGLARAAQTGVKALGRAMEERAGAVRPPAPFENEPMISPGAKVTTSGFRAEQTPGGVDMKNLSASDQATADRLEAQGWNLDKQKQFIDSGYNIRTQAGNAGDNMYGFSSSNPAFAKTADSPFWLDEPTYQAMQSNYQDPATGGWDNAGVKNELALPCYNAADTVYQGQLTSDQTLVRSTVGQAQETVTYNNLDSSTTVFSRTMSGGGSQFAPINGGVGNITRVGGP